MKVIVGICVTHEVMVPPERASPNWPRRPTPYLWVVSSGPLHSELSGVGPKRCSRYREVYES